MGLIIEDIEIIISSSNIKHYKSLGYNIPQVKRKNGKAVTPRGTKIFVKSNDLMRGSSEIVNIICDHCGKIFPIHYYTYTYCNHDGLYYCNNCSSTVLAKGENSPRWNFMISDEERKEKRSNFEYKRFLNSVFIRDNYTCQCCNKKNVKLDVHHINGYNWFIEGRTDINNGITLCRNCHSNFHSIYGRGNNTKSQFDEWIGYTITLTNGKILSSKKVYCIETQKIYESSLHAAQDIGVTRDAMSALCSDGRNNKCIHKTLKGLHFLWYDDFIKMTNVDIKKFLEQRKNLHYRKVICTTTNKIFNTIKEGTELYNIKSSIGITRCCRNLQDYCGVLDNNKLKWMYYEDYISQYKEKLKEGF